MIRKIDVLKEHRASSDGFKDYFSKAQKSRKGPPAWWTHKITIVVVTILLLGGSIAEVVIGSLGLNRCPAQSLLPIYLIVGGIIGGISNVSNGIRKLTAGNKDETGEVTRSAAQKVHGLFQLFLLLCIIVLFVAGNVWVFSTPLCTDHELSQNVTSGCYTRDAAYSDTPVYCFNSVFGMALSGVITRWVLIGVFIYMMNCIYCPILCVYWCNDGPTAPYADLSTNA